MLCATCGNTMNAITIAFAVYWCPRCGTVLQGGGYTSVPLLVVRCREFARKPMDLRAAEIVQEIWDRLGIAESINVPEDQPEST